MASSAGATTSSGPTTLTVPPALRVGVRSVNVSAVTTTEAAAYQPSKAEAEEFERLLEEARRETAAVPASVGDVPVVWAPNPGSQEEFMVCPLFEVLLHGSRGGGKTDALIHSFAQYVGRGFGRAWRGILFRQTYPQLADVVAKSEKWFPQVFPGARLNRARMEWEWPTGERLLLRHMAREQDYWHYHGHEYPWIGWEELTNWADSICYTLMMSCCRSSSRDVPRMVRATTNPYGIGHGWVKERFRLAGQWWKTVIVKDGKDADGDPEPPRAAVHSHLRENRQLLAADPQYRSKVMLAARNSAMADAWGVGSWDIQAGGMFEECWSPVYNIVPTFAVPPAWRIDRAFDWGSSRPFSVGWYTVSDGADLQLSDGRVMATVVGDVFRIREWYGWTGHPNEGQRLTSKEIAAGIVEREILYGWRPRPGLCRVVAGPADAACWTVEEGMSPADTMEQPVRIGSDVYGGVTFYPADKSPGSRVAGWEVVRQRMLNAHPRKGKPREAPGLFVVGDLCPQFVRTVPILPRHEKKLDDVDTEAEDHIGDEVRYYLRPAGTEPQELEVCSV